MIGDAFRYPVVAESGKRNLLVVTASLLAVAVALRYTIALIPVLFAVVPGALAVLALLTLLGTTARTIVSPDTPAGSLRALLKTGAVTLAVTALALVVPVALLLESVRSFGSIDVDSAALVLFLTTSLLSLIFFLAVAYVLPALVASALDTGRVRDAIEGVRSPSMLLRPPYFLAWTIGFPLLVVAWGLTLLAVLSTQPGGLLAAVAGAYVLLVGARVIGAGHDQLPGRD